MRSKRQLCANWKLYVITTTPAGPDIVARVRLAVNGGADVVQLRDKALADTDMIDLARRILAVTRPAGVPLIINDRLNVAQASGADGVHLGQEDGSLEAARRSLGEAALIGRSTHTPDQGAEAEREGFDYIGVGPVFATPTKPTYHPVGLEYVRWAAENLSVPFVAIGGIDADNAVRVREAGARAVAVVRAVLGAAQPDLAAQRIKEVMHVRS